MRRRLLTILSAVSLLLCVASVALWIRGHFAVDRIGRIGVQLFILAASKGIVGIAWGPVPSMQVAGEWQYEHSSPEDLEVNAGPSVHRAGPIRG